MACVVVVACSDRTGPDLVGAVGVAVLAGGLAGAVVVHVDHGGVAVQLDVHLVKLLLQNQA